MTGTRLIETSPQENLVTSATEEANYAFQNEKLTEQIKISTEELSR